MCWPRPPTSSDRNTVWHGGWSSGRSYKFQVSSTSVERLPSCEGSNLTNDLYNSRTPVRPWSRLHFPTFHYFDVYYVKLRLTTFIEEFCDEYCTPIYRRWRRRFKVRWHRMRCVALRCRMSPRGTARRRSASAVKECSLISTRRRLNYSTRPVAGACHAISTCRASRSVTTTATRITASCIFRTSPFFFGTPLNAVHVSHRSPPLQVIRSLVTTSAERLCALTVRLRPCQLITSCPIWSKDQTVKSSVGPGYKLKSCWSQFYAAWLLLIIRREICGHLVCSDDVQMLPHEIFHLKVLL